jgi:Glycosyl transferase family 11
MQIIKIKGGLGNQMFQYAYGRNLEIAGKKIIFDTSFFNGVRAKTDAKREFTLTAYNLKTDAEFSPRAHHLRDFLVKLKRKIGLGTEEYFQSEKYFIGISGELKGEFTLKNDLSPSARNILEQIVASNSVSVHVRRGDYVSDEKTKNYHGVCGLEYYIKAMRLIKEKVAKPVFFVFSDDIGWAKENFVSDAFVFVSAAGIKDYEEMFLMSNCRHNIIANSSFSWWGAWLNNNPDKIVVAPEKWFNDKKANNNDIVPAGWVKL